MGNHGIFPTSDKGKIKLNGQTIFIQEKNFSNVGNNSIERSRSLLSFKVFQYLGKNTFDLGRVPLPPCLCV